MTRAGEKYRPANGTEGQIFEAKWCHKCKKSFAIGDEEDCQIFARAFLFGTDDSEYPTEWIYDAQGKPTCTAFDHVDNPDSISSYRCPDTPDLFGDEAPRK